MTDSEDPPFARIYHLCDKDNLPKDVSPPWYDLERGNIKFTIDGACLEICDKELEKNY